MAFDFRHLAFQVPNPCLAHRQTMVPQFLEHLLGDLEQPWCGLYGTQERFKLTLQYIALDGLAVALTAAFVAEIVGVA
ncbi:TPA: hypothetical protein ACKP97_003907 [Pseudomonas aeruginosa]|uniref:hypothetical protein n=1 Tax=Pseudomonas aeruginosa TaxID=287 RepID=UPI00071B5B77|nr:hypothetical protein [Pseudomonas aeruginosa]AZZ10869.1 hypothetical protein CEK59_04120 [Pseudomonas aeruginosa]EKN9356142.1 hypothetical protein [Pseudomonas aeruginosa]KSJ39170.1 hypothetical protein APA00_16130 [Pseudomonas aeruginosa]MBG5166813.1 hypothetical protein [Pseudomonas aeruginosa]MBS9747724.1 hypothetical protein [Pseudomonas aeruginosa]